MPYKYRLPFFVWSKQRMLREPLLYSIILSLKLMYITILRHFMERDCLNMNGETVTLSEMQDGFSALGVKRGMMLEVHCSLSSFGYVEGGAQTVITALQSTVGNDGAIVMPSFLNSRDFPLSDEDRALGLTLKVRNLHENSESSGMGIVSDTFRQMPGVITGEGHYRVSAWGKDAEQHAASGFQKIIDEGGAALLIGVDIYRMSSMHYVEGCMPQSIRDKFKPSEAARAKYPEVDWFIEAWSPDAKPWYTIQKLAYEHGYIVDRMIGQSKCMLCQVKPVVQLYEHALRTQPFKLYGLE